MFSGLLLPTTPFRTGKNDDTGPLIAQTTNINFRVVSGNGQGSAHFTYVLDKDYDNLVFYVPHLIAHQRETRQYVKLTHCKILVTNVNTGKLEATTLKVSRLVTSEYYKNVSSLPNCAELKKRYKNVVSHYAGAYSDEDVLLHLGYHSASTLLTLQLEFLVDFDCPLAHHTVAFERIPSVATPFPSSQWRYSIQNILPTKQLSYSCTIISPLAVERVVPHLDNCKLEWQYVGNNEFVRNIVHVSCELQGNTEYSRPISCGFSVLFAPGTLSGGHFCCLTGDNSVIRRNTHLNDSLKQLAKQQNWDAIMMLSLTLSREMLPFTIQQHQAYPSEFVFLIDCSGSMSGSNIQSARGMLITCVKSLPNGCCFNVIAFGSHFRQLFHESEKYSKHAVERAVLFANQLQATLGGTDLLLPLQWMLKKPSCGDLPRQVFIITDGGVTNTQQVLSIIKQNKQSAR